MRGVGGWLVECICVVYLYNTFVSFCIILGAQKKTMHNVRVMCGDFLDLCRHKHNLTHPAASPERLLTAMSLYSSKLSALVLMVDGRINSLGGIKEGGSIIFVYMS